MSAEEIVLLSSDNESIRVNIELALVSGVIRTLLETLGVHDEPIPIIRVNGKTLQLVFRWVKHHRHDTGHEWYHQDNVSDVVPHHSKLPHTSPKEISEWDHKFFFANRQHLGAIIDAADYLQIPSLCHLLAKVIAMMMSCTNSPDCMNELETPEVQKHDGEGDVPTNNEAH